MLLGCLGSEEAAGEARGDSSRKQQEGGHQRVESARMGGAESEMVMKMK